MKSTTTFTILCAMLVCSHSAAASALRGTTSDTAGPLSEAAGEAADAPPESTGATKRALFLNDPAGSKFKQRCIEGCNGNCFGEMQCRKNCEAEHKCAQKLDGKCNNLAGCFRSLSEAADAPQTTRRLIVNHPWDSLTCDQCTGDCRGNCLGGMIADYSLQALIEMAKAVGKSKSRGRGLSSVEGVDPWLQVLAGTGNAIDRNGKCFSQCMAEHCTYQGNNARLLHAQEQDLQAEREITQAAAVAALSNAVAEAAAAAAEEEAAAAPAPARRALWGMDDPAGTANDFRCRRSCEANCHERGNTECTTNCFSEHCADKPKCYRSNPCGSPEEEELLSVHLFSTEWLRVMTDIQKARVC